MLVLRQIWHCWVAHGAKGLRSLQESRGRARPQRARATSSRPERAPEAPPGSWRLVGRQGEPPATVGAAPTADLLAARTCSWRYLSLGLRLLAAALPGNPMLHDPPLQGMSGEAQEFSCVDNVACRCKCFEAEPPFSGSEIVGFQVDRDVHGWVDSFRSAPIPVTDVRDLAGRSLRTRAARS